MGRQVINKIECGKCHREFSVSTEDIEWEHLIDAGEVEDGSPIHDYGVFQSVECEHCGAKNKVVLLAKGKSEADFDTMKVISLDF